MTSAADGLLPYELVRVERHLTLSSLGVLQHDDRPGSWAWVSAGELEAQERRLFVVDHTH